MKVYPDITLTRLFMVMKILVNFNAHNLKVVGSNPTPATKPHSSSEAIAQKQTRLTRGGFFVRSRRFVLPGHAKIVW